MLLAIPKALARIVLAITIILAGLMVCIHIPQVTEIVSRLTSNAASVGLSSDAMAKISVSTRDFSLGLIGPEGLKSVLATLGIPTSALDESMLTHLQDCTWVFNLMTDLFKALGIASLVLAVLALIIGRRNELSKLLLQSSILAILILAAFGIWITAGFDSFFTWMHSLFFASGTWTFPADSFLIQMFPESFWIGMGVVWGASSVLFSLALILISQVIKKR